MAILDETKVVDPYNKKDGTGYQKIMFPSDCIAMSDGTDLEESVKGVVLYNNKSGTKSSFTLSDDVKNYKYIEVFFGSDVYKSDTFPSASVKVPTDWDRIQALMQFLNQSNEQTSVIQLESRFVAFNGNTASIGGEKFVNFSTTKASVGWSQASGSGHIAVYKVIGWK